MESSIDRGWSWVVVIAVFGTSVLSFGFLQSTSVFFVDWQEDLNASAQMIGWCSAISIAGIGLAGLVSSVISSYVSCRWQAFIGGLITTTALACSNWVTHVLHLHAIMCFIGFGTGIAYINCFVIVGFYFNKKLGLANGLGSCGSGMGILILSPLIRYLNDEYSWRGAMLICSGILGNLCVFAALFRMSKAEKKSMLGFRPEIVWESENKEDSMSNDEIGNDRSKRRIKSEMTQLSRKPSKRRHSVAQNVRRHSSAFVKSYTSVLSIRFVMICLVYSFFVGFGYFASIMFFVSNAVNLGVSKRDAAFLFSIVGIGGAIGRLGQGPILDKKSMTPFQFASLMLGISGTSCLLGSLARSYPALAIFSATLGFSTSAGNVVFPLMVRAVVGVNHVKKIFGVGIIIGQCGAIISLPLIGRLYDTTGEYAMAFYISGGVMLLNSIIALLDPVWIKLDRRRLGTNERDVYDEQELG
ncbi:monocarboxylate transporter 12-like [Amphiura filiformis]|uniref:monocarboxylate transporter 12-like n=1 Tax=Amphiura filiformis TaxID=82378 RepID=UPI003B21ABF2